MQGVTVLVLVLISCTQNVHTQGEGVRFSLRGTTYQNNSLVTLEEIGEGDDALLCMTDQPACCQPRNSSEMGSAIGNWYFPNGTIVPSMMLTTNTSGTQWDFYVTRDQAAVLLHRRRGGGDGIYCCVIPDAVNVTQTVYIGIYSNNTDAGMAEVISVNFELISEPSSVTPTFTLTCTSTGGPATIVSWRRDGEILSDNTSQMLINSENATYTHTLMVTGRLVGEYVCNVSNNKPSSSSGVVAVIGADSPTNFTAERVNSTTIRVSWIPPVSGSTVTGYRIYYQTEGDQENVDVGVNVTEFTITSLMASDAYNVSVVALSEHFPSAVVGPEIIMPVLLPSAPTIIMAGSHSLTSINLTWTQPAGEVVDSYEVSFSYKRPCDGFNHTDNTTVNGTTRQYTLTGLQEFSNYTVTVVAMNDAGRSEGRSVNIVTMAEGTLVPTMDITISHDDGAFIAGQSYNLTCTVTLENAAGAPTVGWLGPNNNPLSSGITVGDTVPVNCSTYTTTLHFTTLRTSHGGQYSCQATLGVVNNTAAVNITVLSEGVWFSLNGTTYQNNSLVNLEDIGEDDDALLCLTNQPACCRPPYTSDATGNWFFPNGTRIPSSGTQEDFHRTRGDMMVLLHRRRGGEEGVYYCVLPDVLNVAQTIYIGVYTTDTGQPIVTSIIYDDQSNTLTCTSSGGPATNVIWKKDGVVITLNGTYQQTQIVTNTTTSTYQTVLTINSSVNQSDIEGMYNCTVQNIRGESSKTVVVPVPPPSAPTITTAVSQSPTSITLTWTQPEGEAVDSYEVSFSYQGPCTRFNHTNTTTVNGTSRQYTLRGLQEFSNYTVTVVAVNDAGRSGGSSVNVVTLPDGTVVPTLDITISHGGGPFIAGLSYNLTCTVTLENAAGAPTVEWLDPNNNPLDNNSDFTVGDTVTVNCSTYTTTLHFTTLHTSHGGQYSCQATLGVVNNTAAVNITVLSGVWFSLRGTTYQNNSLVTLENIGEDSDTLLCLTDQPACCQHPYAGPIGNWFFPNGTRVLSDNKLDIHRNRGQMVVRLNRRRGGENGIYRCEIPDAMNVNQTIYIGVYTASTGQPIVTSIIYDDQSNTLTCTSSGGPATNVIWKKDGVVITLNGTYQQTQIVTNTTTSTYQTVLTINSSVNQSDIEGMYNCTVENIKGESSKTVVVPVLLPSAPNITMAVSQSSTSIILTWTQPEGEVVDSYEVSFSYQGPCSGFNHTNTTTVNGTTRQYTLTALQEFSNYTVTVVAVNASGRSEESSVNIVTMEDGTLVPTLDINITSDGGSPFIAGQSYNLTCTVTLENVIGAPTVGWLDPTNNPLDNNSDTTVGETVPVNCFTYTTTLHFTTLRTSHGGQYSCQATLGAINNTAAINITAAVNITVLIPPLSAPTITTAVFESPTSITLTWTQPEGEVVDSYEVSFSYQGPCSGFNHTNTTTVNGTTRQYTLTGLQEFSNYTVTVVAVNGAGRSEERSQNVVTMANGTVVPTLDITISQDGGPFIAGQSYNLTCTVTLENLAGIPTAEWLDPNNNPLDNNSDLTVEDTVTVNCSTYTTTLQFTTLRTSHGGQYSCQATLGGVNNTAAVNITVLIPPPSSPTIIMAVPQSPTSITLIWTQPVGEVVDSYEVSFSYQGPCSEFNHTNTTTVNGTTRQYTLTRLQEFSTYTVTVVAVNGAGRSGGSSMNVITLPDGTVAPTLDITISHDGGPFIAGQSYNLTCTVTLENVAGAPTVEWLDPNNNTLDSSSNITVGDTVTVNCSTYTTTLQFTTLHTSDGGQYSCQATLGAINNTAAVNITVLSGGGVWFSLNGTTYQNNSLVTLEEIGEGDDALHCMTDQPACCRPPYIDSSLSAIGNWYFPNETRVPSSGNQWDFHRTRGRMVVLLHRRKGGEDGVYSCVIPDKEGIDQTTYIGVYSANMGSPNVTSLTFNSNYNTLTCTSTGGPATTVTWRKDRAVIILNATYQQTKKVVDSVEGTYQTVLTIDPSVSPSDIFGTYNCTVENAQGKSSETVVLAVPERVQELQLMTVSDQSVRVLWREPTVTNGAIVNYTVHVQKYQLVSGSRELELVAVHPEFNRNIPVAMLTQLNNGTFMLSISEGLDPLVPYHVTIMAVNLAGPGQQETMNFFTREGAPSIAPGNVEVNRLNGTAMNVSWVPLNLVEAQGFVQSYIITYTQANSGSRRRRQAQTRQADGSASYAIVGGLQSGVAYEVTVSGMTVQNGPVSLPARAQPEPTLASPSPSPTRAVPEPTSEGSGAVIAGVIVALVIALVIILVVVIGYFLYNSRCKGEMFNKTKEMYVLTEMYELTENGKPKGSGSVRPLRSSIRSKKDEADEKETDSDVEELAPIPVPSTEVTDRMKPISIISFRDHVQQMHSESNRGFESEYQSLGSEPKASLDVAKRPFNRAKNRFANILPYDFSRVKLNTIKGEEGSDYINASFVDGYNRDRAYIASQGPMPNTVSDFWRMIWEKRLPNIVMLTKCMEAGRRKCEQYWGENVGDDFETPDHKLTITTTYVLPLADFNIRTFTVENIENPDAELLRVTQYHFTSWPDHGVPQFATSLIAFIRQVQKGHNKDDGYPLLVHCSAGVGRTGTFILLDSMLERMKKEDTVNVYEFLCNMRAKRALMVQSQPQYIFAHDALDELITCGETDIPAAGLKVKVNRLRKTIPGKGITGFTEQFQLLEQVSRHPEEGDFSDAQEYYNRGKNRYPDKLPYNTCRAHLRPTGEDGSEYINASFVNGYKHRNAYIATQAPLQTTVDDFWRMIWEFKSKIIVMLCNMMEDNQETSYPYWPTKEEETEKYGNILVTMQSKRAYGDYSVRKFNLQNNKDEDSQSKCFQVTQFHHTEWPETGKPPSSGSGGLIEMMDLLMKTQMNTGNRAITVMCNDGVGRTGAFICIHSQLERLKTEGVVDIFQSIKSARIYRAGLVPQDDQYVFCHEVLADYVDKFENYANFKDMI